MQVRISHPLSRLSVVAVLAFAPLAASAQNAPMMGGEMKGGSMMGDGMKGCDAMGGEMKGCVGGDMMGGGMENMERMMSMMHEKLSHAGDRIASLKTELKITEAQMPAWNKFSDVLIASAKSMERIDGCDAQKDAIRRYAHPSRKTRPLRPNGGRAYYEPAGNQGRARSALCVVQR